MNAYTDFAEKMQSEFLASLKQAQELNLNTLSAVSELMAKMPVGKADLRSVPTPAEAVERSFAFADRVLETRKEFALKLAELATESQKHFADTLNRFAEISKN